MRTAITLPAGEDERGVHAGRSTPSDWNALDDAVPQMRADDQHAEDVEADHQRVARSSPSPGGRDRAPPAGPLVLGAVPGTPSRG